VNQKNGENVNIATKNYTKTKVSTATYNKATFQKNGASYAPNLRSK
jgi:hypothetical protein